MNLVGRTLGAVNWLLFGSSTKLRESLVLVIEHVRDGGEVQVSKEGIFIRYRKEF